MSTKILLVDDNEDFLKEFRITLSFDYQVITAKNRQEGLKLWMQHDDITLALVDIIMPDDEYDPNESGINLIQEINNSLQTGKQSTVLLALTASDDIDIFKRVLSAGGIDRICKRIGTGRIVEFIKKTLQRMHLLQPVAAIQKYYPLFNGNHYCSVANICHKLICNTNDYLLQKIDTYACLLSAQVHDVGLFAVNNEFLKTDRKFSVKEWESISMHCIAGEEFIHSMGMEYEDIARVVGLHHRWYNGDDEPNNYPKTIHGKAAPVTNAIPVESRVLAIAEAYCSLISDRPYRRKHTSETAKEIILQNCGNQFDPAMADAIRTL
jgi:response regulator RpfG family c-di-GMP phosphodiesterase